MSDTKGLSVIEVTEMTSVVPTGEVTEADDWDSDIILRLRPWLVAIISRRRLWRLHIRWEAGKADNCAHAANAAASLEPRKKMHISNLLLTY